MGLTGTGSKACLPCSFLPATRGAKRQQSLSEGPRRTPEPLLFLDGPARPALCTPPNRRPPRRRPKASLGGTGGRRRAQRQAARQLVGSGPRGQGVAARACAEGLSAPVTERRGVGERDLARPAWPPPLGLPLRPRGASRAARPLSGGRARPGVAVSTREAGGGRRGDGAGRSGRGQGEGPAQPRPRWVK